MNLFMSIRKMMARELVPVNQKDACRTLRVAMFLMAGFFLVIGAWRMPGMDLNPAGLLVGWMTLAAVVAQCVMAGLLAQRYRMEKGFRINGQVAWMLVGALVFLGSILGLSQVEEITRAQLRLGCLVAVMLQMNCFILGLLWPWGTETDSNAESQ
jgi:cytochrome bd-type quinol oxidase subunit 2